MILLGTNWYENHTNNLNATIPLIERGDCIFKENGFAKLSLDEVYEKIILSGVKKQTLIDNIFN